MSHELLLVGKIEHVAILTLNQPPLNPLSGHMIEALDRGLNEVLVDDTCRCIVVTGQGEKAFASGADIHELETLDEKEGALLVSRVKEVFDRIRSCLIPSIAAINAHAMGGGLELALHCDFRVAVENVRLGLPEINLGVMPGAGGTLLLPKLIGLAKARWMIMHGEIIDAKSALEIGLLDQVVKKDALQGAFKIAASLAQKPPLSCQAIKKAFLAGEVLSFSDALEKESALFGALCATRDKKEGVRAFLEKRKPEFLGS
jgi:enoyl-CoA hydratase